MAFILSTGVFTGSSLFQQGLFSIGEQMLAIVSAVAPARLQAAGFSVP
jgi:hypothetical protein